MSAAEKISKCPASGCPIMDIEESMWTGVSFGDCPEDHEGCGWYNDEEGYCTAGNENGFNLVKYWEEQGHELPEDGEEFLESLPEEEPECSMADKCQWNQQSELTCPPRLAVMMNLDPKVCLY